MAVGKIVKIWRTPDSAHIIAYVGGSEKIEWYARVERTTEFDALSNPEKIEVLRLALQKVRNSQLNSDEDILSGVGSNITL